MLDLDPPCCPQCAAERRIVACTTEHAGRERILRRPLEATMQIQLSEQEVGILHDLLHDYLPALRREVARTDAKDFRHLLVQRLDLAERLHDELSTEVAQLATR
jgi:hypothetical protein